MKTESGQAVEPPSRRGWASRVSFWLTTPLALILMLHPALMIGRDGHYSHGLLMLVMLGVCAGFVHGVGFKADTRVLQRVLGPAVVWPLLALGYVLLLRAHGL